MEEKKKELYFEKVAKKPLAGFSTCQALVYVRNDPIPFLDK